MSPLPQITSLVLFAAVLGLLFGLGRIAFGPDPALQESNGNKPDPKRLLHQKEIQLLILGLIFLLFMLIWRVAV